jgi:hypothetical protein
VTLQSNAREPERVIAHLVVRRADPVPPGLKGLPLTHS